MKESMWGVFIIGVGVIGIAFVFLFQTLTNTEESNTNLLKEATSAAMYDSIDIAAYRTSGIVRIDREKFAENFFRRFAERADLGYTYKLGLDFDNFKEKFSDEYIILFRTHYLVAKSVDLSKYEGFIYDVSDYSDINDLYILGDLIITDYSSVFFDYANLKRPMMFYMYDLSDYKNNMRDFYIDLDELPGPIVEKEEDLYNEIANIDNYWKKYDKKYEKFNKKYNYLDDENSSKRVLDEIMK